MVHKILMVDLSASQIILLQKISEKYFVSGIGVKNQIKMTTPKKQRVTTVIQKPLVKRS